jgi:photosystem II stability/assembly factor-like uncharacterized protein
MAVKFFRMAGVVVLAFQPSFSGWQSIQSGTSASLADVFFSSAQQGFAVGSNGTFLESSDSGLTWIQRETGYSAHYTSIFFMDTLRGVVGGFGGTVLRTVDGGKTWQKSIVPDSSTTVTNIVLRLSGTGYAVGSRSGKLRTWKTSDGGVTWNLLDSSWRRSDAPETYVQPNSGNLSEICFADSDTGYAVSNGSILRTTDGGSDWSYVVPSYNQGGTIYSRCHFVNGRTGFFVGAYYGDVSMTKNAGDSLLRKVSHSLNDVFFPTIRFGYAVGHGTLALASILKSSDSGATWVQQTPPEGVGQLRALFFINANYGFAVGANGTILRTTDGGGLPVGITPPNRESFPVEPHIRNPFGRVFDALGRSMRSMRFGFSVTE